MGNSTSIADQFGGPWHNTSVTGIKEDYISTPIISWTVLGVQAAWTVLCLVMLVWRRNATYTRQRSPLLLALELLSQSFYVIINCVRFGIGRVIFPCFIYSALWFWIQAAFGLPIVLRGLRLFIVYRLSHSKSMSTALHAAARQRRLSRARSGSTSEDPASSAASSVQPSDAGTQDTVLSAPGVVNAPVEPGGAALGLDLEANDATRDTAHERIVFRRSMRKLNVMRCLVSNPCMLAVMAVVYAIHLALWLLMIGVINPTQYFTNGFSAGCPLGQYKSILAVVIVLIVLYVVAISVVVFMLFFVRDTWRLRAELFSVLVVVSISLIPYIVSTLTPAISDWSDYFVPYFYFLLLAIWGDNFFSIVLPAVISVVHERREKREEAVGNKQDQLHFVLHNKALKDAFRTFSTRSFAVESLVAWDTIRAYRQAKSSTRRRAIGQSLVAQFIEDGSPLELNLTAKLKRENWLDRLDKTDAAVDVFDALMRHCESDMLDNFSRFSNTAQYRKLMDAARQEDELKEKTSALI